ncbi:serine/threonine-protein kinase [Marinagarivorans cellulosilyticus]|uniref:Eukaryotic-like serine/threonine-protein kinase n=1 Tax=Marinagarivorans cellulosilyticus TaxID=2721545 RepID=A0AAN1WGI5_9GAMM|nr:serine/threonine-protein kinase [Marinagarivorans cellulosilyticus]BCD97153.1 eukaryotic-like serine/threonine-protein kinase [Marinagarivorans cellulosilyticus]
MPKLSRILSAERILVFSSIVICIVLSLSQFTNAIDRLIYDSFGRLLNVPVESDVAIIAVDDRSIESLGRWPWPRHIHASLIEKLNEVSPRLIIINFLFSEKEKNNDLSALKRVKDNLLDAQVIQLESSEGETLYMPGAAWLDAGFISKDVDNKSRGLYLEMQESIVKSLGEAVRDMTQTLDAKSGDIMLSQALQGDTSVLMPLYFHSNNNRSEADPEYLTSNSAAFLVQGTFSTRRQHLPVNRESAIYPIAMFGNYSHMLGHVNDYPDSDGKVRKHSLLIHHNGQLYPSLALSATAADMGYSAKDILYQPGSGVVLGKNKYRTDENLAILPSINYQRDVLKPFDIYSYSDVLSDEAGFSKFNDKIIILGITANGLSNRYKASGVHDISPTELLASNIASLSNMKFYYTPAWSKAVIWLLFITISLALLIFARRMSIKHWIVIVSMLVVATLVLQWSFLTFSQIWLPFSSLYVLSLLAFLLVNLWNLSTFEKKSFQTQIESSESNKVLGLTYQNQGQLDLAFDKFKRCKPDESIADALYGLGLDFERKRLNHKASLVYQYIEKISPSYKDIINRIQAIESGVSIQVASISGDLNVTAKRTVNTGILEQPTFGRYQVEKEIGRGGMGAVYLGRDPRIDRKVAIKTLDFFADYTGDLLVEAKKRFSREAIAIGKLNHSNIVTIYDVGEDHDLAYIAMEYLFGVDLNEYTLEGRLLPLEEVVKIGIVCAEALDYAHSMGVVHRDIKPSNIVYDQKTEKVWLTDFGIALLLDSGGSKTSSAIGSPGYMSPEQIKREALDGRSDIYSLGVTLFQLLSGTKPFDGGGASSISFSIVNNPTPELKAIMPSIPQALSNLIFKAMQKDKSHRFSTAAEMKKALEDC